MSTRLRPSRTYLLLVVALVVGVGAGVWRFVSQVFSHSGDLLIGAVAVAVVAFIATYVALRLLLLVADRLLGDRPGPRP